MISNNPKVSILVPVYGVEKYIERCARSIFEQTYRNLEIIFVDDSNPDKSFEILSEVLEDYPERKKQTRILKHNKNLGLSAARNTAVDAATGEFIMHVDSDDWMELNAVEVLMEEQKKTGADIVTGQAIKHDTNKWQVIPRPQFNNKNDFVLDMASLTINHTIWGRLIRRSLYVDNHIRNKEGVNVGEDFQSMTMLACVAKQTSAICNVVYHYNCMNNESYTRGLEMDANKSVKVKLDDLHSAEYIYEFFSNQHKEYIEKAKEVIKQCVRNLRCNYVTTGDWKNFMNTKHILRKYRIHLNPWDRYEHFYFVLVLLRNILLKRQ